MGHVFLRTALTLGLAAAAMAASPAQAQLVSAKNPAAIKTIIESRGWSATLVSKTGEDPYIESSRDGVPFLVLFMNCKTGRDCGTLQYYMGFNNAKGIPLDRLNQWNREKRFARAYRDTEGDPVLEMDVDLDFRGIPHRNVVESLDVWASLMDSFRAFVLER